MDWNWDETIAGRWRKPSIRFSFFVIVLPGWMNQRQQNVIEYLREENRVMRDNWLWGMSAAARSRISCGGTALNQRPRGIEKQPGRSSSSGIGN